MYTMVPVKLTCVTDHTKKPNDGGLYLYFFFLSSPPHLSSLLPFPSHPTQTPSFLKGNTRLA